jgi:hypothetical protein
MSTKGTGRLAHALTLAAALLVASGVAGCYTLLSHPRTDATYADADPTEGSCLRCHAGDSFDAGAVPWVEHYGYSSYPWINYYGSPWWYESVWYWYEDDCRDCPSAEAPPRLAGRNAWGRRPRGGWDTDDTRERTSSALTPIVGPSPPAPAAAPPAITGSTGKSDTPEEPEADPPEPRKRSIRR